MKKLTTLLLMLSLGLFSIGCGGAEDGGGEGDVPAVSDDAPDLAPLPDATTPDTTAEPSTP